MTAVAFFTVQLCAAQSSTGPSAKQHYESANGNQSWGLRCRCRRVACSNEAYPPNALLFYDLGIVLKRQDKNADATQALQIAIRLGLPADKKLKANQMLAELSSANQPQATETQSPPKLEETLDWLKSQLPGMASFEAQCSGYDVQSGNNAQGDVSFSTTSLHCRSSVCLLHTQW